MFERWGIADGSGLLVRDNFGRFVVSASLETSGQGGGDADAGGAVFGEMGIAARVLLKEDLMTAYVLKAISDG